MSLSEWADKMARSMIEREAQAKWDAFYRALREPDGAPLTVDDVLSAHELMPDRIPSEWMDQR